MPTLNFTTNVKIPDTKAFVLEFTKFAAETLGKPEAVLQTIVTYNEALTFGGTFDPAFSLSIITLGNLSAQLNEGYSKAFSTFFKEKLGLSDDRGFILFVDPGAENIGYKGTTTATIISKQ